MKFAKRLFIPSIADILFASVFLNLCFSAGKGLLGDCDTGYHIIAGNYMLNTLSIPRHDMFSFLSPPLPWTAHEWLSEIIMALLHQAFGLTGVVIFFSFVIALTFYLFFRTIRSFKPNLFLSVMVILLSVTCTKVHWLARPHIFSMLLLVIWYYLLDLYQYRDRDYLFFFPPLMLLWVNLHGGFVSGFVLLGAYLLGNLLRAFGAEPDLKPGLQRKVKRLTV